MFPAGTSNVPLLYAMNFMSEQIFTCVNQITLMLVKFGNCGSLEQHGFARSKIWTVDDNPPPLHPNDSHGKSFIDLLLKPSEEDLKCWPYRYELGVFLFF